MELNAPLIYAYSHKRGLQDAAADFYWPVRTLWVQVAPKQYQQRMPAMVAGLTDHIGTIQEWGSYPAFKRIRL